MVASIISAMVSDPRFADAIKAKIGSAVDTNDLEKQLEALQAQLRQTLGTKARLERQMDGLDVNDPYYDRKISDLQRRYDEQYGRIDEIEVQIDDVQSQIRSIRQEKISGDNIYRLLLAFDQVYEAASEVERKEFMRAFIERIELFPEKQPDGNWIRKIIFNFPVPVNGTEVTELPLENETMVETVCLLSKLHEAKHHVNVRLDMDELDITSAESKATYEEIKSYVAEHNEGMKVSNLYIAQVKAKYGIIERENYNKPKLDDARQPKCPNEKEEAIVDAMEHFKMI